MPHSGPIILVDDDIDDHELLSDALRELEIANELVSFDLCAKAFTYLKTTTQKPLIILCDVNLPGQNGIEFKRAIDEDSQLRPKSIPFVFFSTSIERKAVDTAYKELTVQGFFQKPSSYTEFRKVVRLIIEYWKLCTHPNS